MSAQLQYALEVAHVLDELDTYATDMEKRLRAAQERALTPSELARIIVGAEVLGRSVVPAEIPADVRARLNAAQDATRNHLSEWEQRYTDGVVAAEIGADLLAKLNAARDATASELVAIRQQLSHGERLRFDRRPHRRGQRSS